MRRAGAAVALAAVILAAGCAGDADAGDDGASEAAASAEEPTTTSPVAAGEDAEGDSTEAVEGEGGDGPGHVTVAFGTMLPFQIDSFACTDDASRLDGTLTLSSTAPWPMSSTQQVMLDIDDPSGAGRLSGDGVEYTVTVFDADAGLDLQLVPDAGATVAVDLPAIAIIGIATDVHSGDTGMLQFEGACGS